MCYASPRQWALDEWSCRVHVALLGRAGVLVFGGLDSAVYRASVSSAADGN